MIRVPLSAVLSDLAFLANEGPDVAHLDGTDGKLAEEELLVLGESFHEFLVGPGSAPQRLVASDDALPLEQVLVVAVVELVWGRDVQILQHFEFLIHVVLRTRLSQVVLECGVGVGVVEEGVHYLAPNSANCVRT
jgi:hypothetical protein